MAGLAVFGVQFGPVGKASAQDGAPPSGASEIFATTYDYVANFYPLWFTYYQWLYSSDNRFAGPEKVTPLYQIVVAINVDTIYASSVMDLANQPVLVTLPPTKTRYSILSLDPFGTILDIDIEPEAGTYVFVGPGYDGPVPIGLKTVEMPLDTSFLIIRADKYSETGQDLTRQAERFRKRLTTQTLSDFMAGETPEPALVLPEAAFAIPFKTVADFMVAYMPVEFLKLMQNAVHATDYDYSAHEQALSDKFDSLFGTGSPNLAERLEFEAGTRAAHKSIVNRYLKTRGATNWTHFTNIGDWGPRVIDRAAITEFCQYCNGIGTAAYYHAFYDNRGRALDGSKKKGYVLRIPKKKLPDVSRFWSLTAYTPDSVELVDNPADKYVVASYTPGLQYNANGSLTLYLAQTKPSGVPKANWLPVSEGEFNVMLRLYGPQGDVSNYLPPAIRR
ncbi:DUF1214 domain-containing protein [Microbaculum marinum]|uniref:DUF1214 domain-containing protein n=1 Tax=Microbaculum marinum TaxID=1764581 RepID=A0AAW9RTM0_9HYPH